MTPYDLPHSKLLPIIFMAKFNAQKIHIVKDQWFFSQELKNFSTKNSHKK